MTLKAGGRIAIKIPFPVLGVCNSFMEILGSSKGFKKGFDSCFICPIYDGGLEDVLHLEFHFRP